MTELCTYLVYWILQIFLIDSERMLCHQKKLLRFLFCFEGEEVLHGICFGSYNKVKHQRKINLKRRRQGPFSYFLRIYRPTWYIYLLTPLAVYSVYILCIMYLYTTDTLFRKKSLCLMKNSSNIIHLPYYFCIL